MSKNSKNTKNVISLILSYILVLLIIVAILSLAYYSLYNIVPIIKKYINKKESFTVIRHPLTPGKFPVSVSKPLLKNFYPLKDIEHGHGVSANNSEDNFALFPSFPAAHCGTNNKRFWSIPDNGLCSRAEMCETLYNKKSLKKVVVNPPTIDGGVRVNYFNSKLSSNI